MNSETLEALLMDRALGHLSPEVESLLAEHLVTSPTAAHAAAELSEVVLVATAALRRTNPKLELPARVIALPRWPRVNRVLAMAASFAIGAGVAFLAMRGMNPRHEIPVAHEAQPAPVVAQISQRPPEVERALRKLPFWSKERAILIAGATNPATH